MRAQKYKTEAESFGWSFVFQDFVPEELKSKVTQRIEVVGCYMLFRNNMLLRLIISIHCIVFFSVCDLEGHLE